ncbi:MAG: hypothetical protein ACOC0N_05675 [Chroococcales cyanobacterium]
MADVRQIKFFLQQGELYADLYDNSSFLTDEFWIQTIKAEELGIESLPPAILLDQKYPIERLGIQPFSISQPIFDFFDTVTKQVWRELTTFAVQTFL